MGWPRSLPTLNRLLIPQLKLTPILGTATTVAWDIMDMAMDSVMAMVATMVAIVPTAMAMDTMAARRGLLSLNQLLIPLLKPMLILGHLLQWTRTLWLWPWTWIWLCWLRTRIWWLLWWLSWPGILGPQEEVC